MVHPHTANSAAKDGSDLLELEVPNLRGTCSPLYGSGAASIASERTRAFCPIPANSTALPLLITRALLASYSRPERKSGGPDRLLLSAYIAGRSLFEGTGDSGWQRIRAAATRPIVVTETSRLWLQMTPPGRSVATWSMVRTLLESAVKRDTDGAPTALMASAGGLRTLRVLREVSGGPAPWAGSHGDG
jgi:hypothetical protein